MFPIHHCPPSAQLAELKMLSAGATRYHGGGETVDKRASKLPKDYENKLRVIDEIYLETEADEVGPLRQNLRNFGDLHCLVIGQFGEGSQDFHELLRTFAHEKADKVARSNGQPVSEHERGLLLQHLRHRVSVCSVRAQASCLLSRLGHTGPGAKLAAQRRSFEKKRQEMIDRDLACHFEAHICGRRLQRLGGLHIQPQSCYVSEDQNYGIMYA